MLQIQKKTHSTSFLYKVIIVCLGFFLLSGCAKLSDPETSQSYHKDVIGFVDQNHTFEYRFNTRQSRIDGIYLWLGTSFGGNPENGKITFFLYNPIDASTPLAQASIKYQSYQPNIPVYIAFSLAEKPKSKSYKLVIRSTTSNGIQVYGRAEDYYPQGTAYQDSVPLPGDIAFRINYEYDFPTFWKDLRSILPQFNLITISLLFLFVPGFLFLSVTKISRFFNLSENIGLSVALSMALPVVIMVWTSLINIRWTQRAVWIIYLGIAILFILYVARSMLHSTNEWLSSHHSIKEIWISIIGWMGRNWQFIILMAIFVFTLIIRLIMIRDLAAPPWVDSVHHALLTRIIMEQGQLPDTYSPYIISDNARYHPGYHVIMAVFQWLSGLELQTGMLIFGQILNAAMVLAVFLFASTLTQNSKISLLAALISGVFTPMPAYYTSWGRYTQLAGLLILPAAYAMIKLCLSAKFARIKEKPIRILIFLSSGICCAGLFVIHYRVIFFLGLLLLALFIVRHLSLVKNSNILQYISRDYIFVLAVIVISVIIAMPWLISSLTELILPKIETSVKSNTSFSAHSWSYLTAASGLWTLYLAGAGILLGLFTRKKFVWKLMLWMTFLFIIANINRLRLPMSGLINNTSVEISLFLPVAVLAGYFMETIIHWIGRFVHGKWHLLYRTFIFGGILYLTFLGTQKLLPIMNPDTILAHQADIPAIHWIENNIPADETILINPLAWGYGLYTGADGGFWITPLSGRKTMPPPLLYGFDTQGKISRYVTKMSQIALEKAQNPLELHAFLQANGIHYIYFGAKGGEFSPTRLISSQLFDPIYHAEGVWIFTLNE